MFRRRHSSAESFIEVKQISCTGVGISVVGEVFPSASGSTNVRQAQFRHGRFMCCLGITDWFTVLLQPAQGILLKELAVFWSWISASSAFWILASCALYCSSYCLISARHSAIAFFTAAKLLVKHWRFAAKLSVKHWRMTCKAIWFGWMLPDWLNLNSYSYSPSLWSPSGPETARRSWNSWLSIILRYTAPCFRPRKGVSTTELIQM